MYFSSMYYHCAILLLFRPFLRVKFSINDISAINMCHQSASAISDLFALHLRLYKSVGICAFHTRCLLNACTIHLLDASANTSATYLTTAIEHFQDLDLWLHDARNCIDTLTYLARKWKVKLPIQTQQTLSRTGSESAGSLISENIISPQVKSFEREKIGVRSNSLV
jgi:hypothetical protein